jgi:NADPH:quinone reductase
LTEAEPGQDSLELTMEVDHYPTDWSLAATPGRRATAEHGPPVDLILDREAVKKEMVMRAVAVSEYRADARLVEFDKPRPGPGQILVRVEAAGMNPMDRAIADGAFSEVFPATFPLILGVDVAGVVEAVGEGSGLYSIGDRVFGKILSPPLGASGAYADYAAIAADATVSAVPDGLSSDVAATLPTPGVTAFQLARSLEPSGAKTIAVVGAGGAVGGFLTQLLATAGARVLAVAFARQADRLRSYGAHEVLDATGAPVADQIRRAAPGGVDVLVDLVSDPEQFLVLANSVRSDGTAVSTRYVADLEALTKMGIRGLNFVVQATAGDLQAVAGLTVAGQLVPPPIRTVGLDDVADLLNSGGDGFDGKTIVRPS